MVGTLVRERSETAGVRLASPLELSDAASTAEYVLAEAIEFCVQKMAVGSREAVVDLLRRDNRTACGYCLYGMAKHMAASLGAMDGTVKAVYILDYDATPEDLCFGTLRGSTPLLHLIVWSERKTAALSSLLAGLDRALARAYADLVGGTQAKSLLDVQTIDDADVEHRVGYAALLHAIHQRPIQVWER